VSGLPIKGQLYLCGDVMDLAQQRTPLKLEAFGGVTMKAEY
jgi:hypothetical protein